MLTTPSYAQTGRLSQIFISDNMDANDPTRIALLKRWIERLTISKSKGFNAIRTFIAPSELGTATPFTEIFRLCYMSQMEFVADSIDTIYKQGEKPYAEYISKLDNNGLIAFAVDDAQRYDNNALEAMCKPIWRINPSATIILSSGAKDAPRLTRLAGQLGCLFELQAYRQGEDTVWPGKWLTQYPVGCLAFETFKTDTGKMTSVTEIVSMGKGILAQEILPRHWAVYAGKDQYTDLLTKANVERLKAVDALTAQVWERWGL